MTLVGNREINNVEVEVHAHVSGGWSILLPEVEGEDTGHRRNLGTGDTLDAAVNKARQEIKQRQVKVSVPFKTRDGKKGVAHSRHARATDKILANIGSKKEQIGYRDIVFKPDMPQDIIDHLNELEDEEGKIRSEIREIVKKWTLDLGKAVDTAISAKAAEQEKLHV